MEIKYTTDGKKVTVIEPLNNTEYIVQEIFVTESGKEIASGEKFVAKSLLDEPAKSYKELALEKLEARYESEKAEWEKKIKTLINEKELAYKSLSARVRWLRQVAKEPQDERFKKVINVLQSFLCDEDKWIFIADYSTWDLYKFNNDGYNQFMDNTESYYGRTGFRDMRLLSLFGKTNGDFEWGVSGYSDGSGSNSSVEFFDSYETAIQHIQNRFDSIEKYGNRELSIAAKFNLKLNKDRLKAFNNDKIRGIKDIVTRKKQELEQYEQELKDAQHELAL